MLQNFKKRTFIPKFNIFATRCEKSRILTIFGCISAIWEDFLTKKEKITQKVKVASYQYAWGAWPPFFFIFSHGMLQNFKQLTFIPDSYFGHQGWKSYILTIFGHISAILEDFLTKKEKITKRYKLRVVDTLGEHGLRFFFFSQEMLQNFKKLIFIQKLHIMATRGEKSCILTIFGCISAILEDFLTERKKISQKVKVASCWYDWGAWPPFFFIFSQEMIQNFKKKWLLFQSFIF